MKNVVVHDAYDKKAFERFLKNNRYLKALLRNYEQFSPLHEKLAEDTFYAFFKYVVEFNEVIEEEFKINKIILEGGLGSIEYEKTKLMTELDEVNAGMATNMFLEKFLENIKALKLQKEYKKLAEMAKNKEKGNGEGISLDSEGENTEFDEFMSKIKDVAKNSLKEISEDIGDTINGMNAVSSWGSGKGDKKSLNPEERIKLASKILENKTIHKIVKKLGRLKLIAINEYKSKIIHYSGEIYSIKMGDDLKHLLPKELVNFSDEILYLDFLRKFVDKKLLTYDLDNEVEKSKGPIIVLLDHSGSMYGKREIWGKAVALSIIEIAKKEKRKFGYIAFDDDVRFKRIFNDISIDDILELASLYYGGGTNFERPLECAIEIVKKDFENADIVLITDGYADVSDEFLKKLDDLKKDKKLKLTSIFIEVYPTETIKKISDELIKVFDLTDEDAKKVFRKL
ncbi:VWA domain-containing protein [Methanotorris formicicus]|uniref:von Willebrand factor type A n=1 Tax=Methanotorris formicicus Mc-S-70 TaxID=647171 RepID=H1KYU0_9EURY|nr:VWA domain-containing protein [Methanotorris formicicus]EHP86837.1 von Willebrand factor type A [Methanotorris formicicus Mc-S-70]